LSYKSKKEEEKKQEYDTIIKQVKEVLGDKVKEVRLSHRLTTSPSCLVADDHDMGIQMQRLLKAAGQDVSEVKPIFELNPDHQLVHILKAEQNADRFNEWTHILFDQAMLAEGGQLKDPAAFVQRINKLLLELAQ